jgi:hypothetical protein
MDPTTFLIIGAAIAIILLIIGLLISAADERALVDKRLEYLDQDTIPVKKLLL